MNAHVRFFAKSCKSEDQFRVVTENSNEIMVPRAKACLCNLEVFDNHAGKKLMLAVSYF